MRLISSQLVQPTSPSQTSLVPGRMVNRNGLRSPCATIRRAFGSGLPESGFPAAAAPVSGFSRRIAPSRPVESTVVRRSWLRREPPSAVGGVSARARAARWIAARVDRASVLPPIGEREAGAVPSGDVERSVGAESERTYRVARELLAPVVDQHLLGAGHEVAVGSQLREPTADDTARAGRVRAGVSERWRATADGSVERVEDVDKWPAGREPRVESEAEKTAIPEVVNVRREIRERVRRRVGEAVEDLDDAVFLSDEHPAVGDEAHGYGIHQPGRAEVRDLLEAWLGDSVDRLPGRIRTSALRVTASAGWPIPADGRPAMVSTVSSAHVRPTPAARGKPMRVPIVGSTSLLISLP